jgi:hypothetical protein
LGPPWIWLWHLLSYNSIVWMVLELVRGIGAQYRAPLPHEGKSPPTIPRSPALYSPEITSLPFPDPSRVPLRDPTRKKEVRASDSIERRPRWQRRWEVDPHCGCAICKRALPHALVLVHLRPTSVILPPSRSVFLLVSSCRYQ